eukprot:6827197-Pyramimonas_sp.AAC.1
MGLSPGQVSVCIPHIWGEACRRPGASCAWGGRSRRPCVGGRYDFSWWPRCHLAFLVHGGA